ncbi:MAG: glutathione S-transferase N-terminal domain-containing protein [Sphingomonadaceae bacterium]|nr:glutathione S-transferase N-terminal domain-containing protein [Sphingomonadaceae bacterium]
MKLYYAPGACSLASHIALEENGAAYEAIKVDLKTHTTEHGADFRAISPRGYVPAIYTGETGLLTENPAVLMYLADQGAAPPSGVDRYKMLEWLGFTGTEVHNAFGPLFRGAEGADKAGAKTNVSRRLALAAELMGDAEWLVGDAPTVADNYLFVMTLWAGKLEIELPPALVAFRERNMGRESVRRAMAAEGLG